MRYARFTVGLMLACAPLACAAQQAGTGSVAEPPADTGALLLERLDAAADGALALEDVGFSDALTASWAAENDRYAERSAELRARCHDEIRKSNRDTIVEKASLCLRGDVQLEIGHRRKEREIVAAAPGVDPSVIGAATTGIDAWIDAATAVVDGADAGVFTTLDMLKEAKDNLHATYRVPMLRALTRVRSGHALAVATSLAGAVRDALAGEAHPFLGTFVPCIEGAHTTLAAGASPSGDVAGLRSGLTQLRSCITLVRDARRA